MKCVDKIENNKIFALFFLVSFLLCIFYDFCACRLITTFLHKGTISYCCRLSVRVHCVEQCGCVYHVAFFVARVNILFFFFLHSSIRPIRFYNAIFPIRDKYPDDFTAKRFTTRQPSMLLARVRVCVF